MFWYDDRGSIAVDRCFGISDSWLSWEERGIIACIIYEYFLVKLIYSKPLWQQCMMNGRFMTNKVYDSTRAWLKEHNFPPETALLISDDILCAHRSNGATGYNKSQWNGEISLGFHFR
jgi:hypothetical protein